MSEQINITLNQKKLSVNPDQTILEVARAEGIEIPTLCYDERMKPFASCFICVVEVEGARTLIPACSTKITPNMVVSTNSEQVTKTRKMAVDLMLSDHAGDCTAPCIQTCPAHIDIQGYIAHIANGDYTSAIKLIKEKNPLPVICGRICPHPCEDECRRNLVDGDAVAIDPLKRFAAEMDLEQGPYLPKCDKDSGKKISIAGGGPAGLTAAYYLRQYGHEVHIYEALPQLGGMTRYGIPKFRLPWDKLDAEIKAITDLGVHVHYNKKMGVDFSIDDLKNDGADAVLIAVGAHSSKPMRVENEDAPGVIGGVEFLRKVVLGEEVNAGKKVAVIGGGDVAMDCARVAKRLGTDVTLLYRRTQKEMPALQHEQDETIGEGVEFKYLTAPTSVVLDKDGKMEALRVITMELGEPDDSGRRRPVPVEGSEEDISFDLVISAIGQDPDLSFMDKDEKKLETTRWKTVIYDEKNMTTPSEGVFTAGDCAFGPNTVVQAVGEGKIAAQSINLYLQGAKIEFRQEYSIARGKLAELNEEDFAPRYQAKKRANDTVISAKQRLASGGYEPISVGIDEAQALAEATRCIECGCSSRHECSVRNLATEYGSTEKKFAGHKRNYDVDDRHPLVRIEADKCITCGNCVRICSEVREINALSFVKRGFNTKVAPSFEEALQKTDCDACGMCIDVCPTGAIMPNTDKKYGPWPSEPVSTSCTSCGNGCALSVDKVGEKIIGISSINNDTVNGSNICGEGRFTYQLLDKISNIGDIEKAKTILEKSKRVAIIIGKDQTLENIFAAYELAKKFNGQIYYQEESYAPNGKFPYSKVEGTFNIAYLQKLGATCWNNKDNEADCVIALGSYLKDKPKKSKLISLSRYPIGAKADANIIIADQLETSGTFLTNESKLAFLKGANADDTTAGYKMISAISGMNHTGDLFSIRKQISEMIPELNVISSDIQKRLVDTNLTISLASVTTSARSNAYQNYLSSLGL